MRTLDFSIANPDQEPAEELVAALQRNTESSGFHRYPPDETRGSLVFRAGVAEWFAAQHDVALHTDEVLPLNGTKEAALYLVLALTQLGDTVVVAEPCYPVYRQIVKKLGRRLYSIPLSPDSEFTPDLSSIPREVWEESRLWMMNFPTNPTGALAREGWMRDLIDKSRKHGFSVCNDFTYGKLYFGEVPPRSFLELAPKGSRVVELISFSKALLIPGWRVGAMLGHPEILEKVQELKVISQAGIFYAMQKSIVEFLSHSDDFTGRIRAEYGRRAQVVVDELRRMGLSVFAPRAGMFVWARAPHGSATEFCRQMAERWRVKFVPGCEYGDFSDQYFRISLTAEQGEIAEMLHRMEQVVYENSYL